MKIIKNVFLQLGILLACLLLASQVIASSAFVVKKIEIRGTHRITRGTVLNYLPLHVGQTLKPSQTTNLLKALYDTGFFDDIQLDRRGNTLIITLKERPTVGSITLDGNKSIPSKQLKKTLRGIGIGQGLVFSQSTSDNVQQSLQREYYNRGKYNATVDTVVTPVSENRVAIKILIHEGPDATIKKIKIIGNHKFKEKELLKQFKLKKKWIGSFFTKDAQYSREKLNGDLETLKSFYLNQGYIKFKVNSSHVSLSPDKRYVYIVIDISEGALYHLSGYQLAGKLIRPRAELDKLVTIKPGEIFSQANVTYTTMRIGNHLGDYGYVYAKVIPMPHINEANKTVSVTFLVKPDNLYYVRRITFDGNTKTLDHVLRNAVVQQESAMASLKNIQDSEHHLNLLGFVKGVRVNNTKVPGTDDRVDVNFHVVERPSATLRAGAGYSDTRGLLINGGYSQPNFLGTGKSVSFNIGRTDDQRNASFNYFNPYYTDSGIGRGFSLYASQVDAERYERGDYTADDYGINMNFSIPIAEYKYLSLGIGYQLTRLHIGDNPSQELLNYFSDQNAPIPFQDPMRFFRLFQRYRKSTKDYKNIIVTAGITLGTYDRAILPTRGFMHSLDVSLALPGGGEPLEYYTVDYVAHYYHPLFKGFILSARAALGYGQSYGSTKYFPFFRNYHAGGIGVQGAVRGYDGFTLGPTASNQRRLGGNFLAAGSLELILPPPFSGDSFRTAIFLDGGNVYNTTGFNTSGDSGAFRFSTGVAVTWRSPMGPVEFSLARPLNRRKFHRRNGVAIPADEISPFQFTVATAL